ncbi:MAG: SIS domain-containing protein [Candidatus Helarchaeota archaeon]
MLKIKVPINETKFEKSFNTFNNTWAYLIEQIEANLNYIFENETEVLTKFIQFIISYCHPEYSGKSKIVFASVGRSLFMGAKTAAMRLSQLGFNVDFPYSSKEIAGPGGPGSKIEEGDVVIAISTSGSTPYVVNKVNYAKNAGCSVVAATANERSLLTQGNVEFILKIPGEHNKKKILSNYDEGSVFAPMGTSSECTQMVFWEIIGTGLNFLIQKIKSGKELQLKDFQDALTKIRDTYKTLLFTAKQHLKNCSVNYNDEIKMFIANMILFYYSNHTVHLFGRGKIFNVVITPFEMRLRQMPHGYVTSILKYAPKNRPIRPGQIAILVSGSGGIATTAKKVKELSENGCMIMAVSSAPLEHEFWANIDNKIRLEGRQNFREGSWEKQQWEGLHADFAPEGFQFEFNSCVLFESIYGAICNYIGISENDLKKGHANYE